MLGGIRWHLESVTHLTKLRWLALCKEERRLIECRTIDLILLILSHVETQTPCSDHCSDSWQQRWWANPVLLQQMSASSAARTDPGTAALQRVIISRVTIHCSTLTSRVQLTAVINYPLCSNRNRFPVVSLVRRDFLQASHWPISAHQRATHTREKKSEEKYDGGNWRKQIGLSSSSQLKLMLQTTIRPISFTAYHRHQCSDRSPARLFAAHLHPFVNLLVFCLEKD